MRILITGCSTGIGRASAVELTKRGHDVIATARRPDSIADLDVAEKLTLDVDRDESVRAAVDAAGEVDVLVNIAVMTGFLVLTGSMAFFTGRTTMADMGFNAMMILSSYPVDIFVGASKVLLYSVVPAAFIAAVPARLIGDPGLGDAVALVVAAVVFSGAGWAAFTLGLRRYTSGAAWTRA